jgi:hypothetical protein
MRRVSARQGAKATLYRFGEGSCEMPVSGRFRSAVMPLSSSFQIKVKACPFKNRSYSGMLGYSSFCIGRSPYAIAVSDHHCAHRGRGSV